MFFILMNLYGLLWLTNCRGCYLLLLQDMFLKLRSLSFFFSQDQHACHTLCTSPYPQTPRGFPTWCWSSDWGLENMDMKCLQLYILRKWVLLLRCHLCRGVSKHYSKESTGGAVGEWSPHNRKAGQFRQNLPLFPQHKQRQRNCEGN